MIPYQLLLLLPFDDVTLGFGVGEDVVDPNTLFGWIEYTAHSNRIHYQSHANRLQFTTRDNRLQYTAEPE